MWVGEGVLYLANAPSLLAALYPPCTTLQRGNLPAVGTNKVPVVKSGQVGGGSDWE